MNPELRSESKKRRVLMALSGGVDSSASAALLLQKGYEVIGVSMKLWSTSESPGLKTQGCCSPEDIRDARRVADILDIPFLSKDLTREFQSRVVDYFTGEYAAGRTPNPCILCNQKLKFDVLFHTADELGADYVATGHYADVVEAGGATLIRRGADPEKDQSYYLFGISPDRLKRVLFPLGGWVKSDVRKLAESFGLPTAQKEESQEICFIQEGSYKEFLEPRIPKEAVKPGDFVLPDGTVAGRHRGIPNYTIGQRRGLGIGHGERLYVTEIDPTENVVRLGTQKDLLRTDFIVENTQWMVPPGHPMRNRLTVQIRSRHRSMPAEVFPLDGNLAKVRFQTPQSAIAPGQAAVFYHNDLLVGGGWISRSIPSEERAH